MSSDFESPPLGKSMLVAVGGVVTAVMAIFGLEYLGSSADRSITGLDARSQTAEGVSLPPAQMSAQLVLPSGGASDLTPAEMAMARRAWTYFQANWQPKTGSVNSVNGFAAETMWDRAAAIAALVSAKELNLVDDAEFQAKMSQNLKTMATMPLYRGQLPNKVYNSKTVIPVNYGKLNKREEIGWSAIDLGRMAIWLKIVGTKYPQFKPQTEAIWKRWQVGRLVKDGQMYGTSVVRGKEQYNQEGRLGYEQYAAFGLKLWGLDVHKALDAKRNTAFVGIYGQGVPYDKRDFYNSEANNYVLSEPYILDGIETGFQALPKAFADRVLAAQEARYLATKQLTAATEDNLDRAPYFVYNSVFANGKAWANINEKQQNFPSLKFISAKAAIGWHVIYRSNYTQKLFDFADANLKGEGGWYNGYYEILQEPNKAQTANNNGVILQSLLYKKVGQPLILWAGVQSEKLANDPANTNDQKPDNGNL